MIRRVLSAEEVADLQAALEDPDHMARLLRDAKASRRVEVDNPLRREVRPRRGTD